MAMIFSELYTIREELLVGTQCSTPCGYQGWEAFRNLANQLCQFSRIELGMRDIQVDVLGHKA